MQHLTMLKFVSLIMIIPCITQSAEKNLSAENLIKTFIFLEDYKGTTDDKATSSDATALKSSTIAIPRRAMMPIPNPVMAQSVAMSISPSPLLTSEKPTYYRCGIYSSKNERPLLEDKHVVKELSSGQLFAIFDGNAGQDSADYLKENIADIFEQCLTKKEGNIKKALREACAKIISIEMEQQQL